MAEQKKLEDLSLKELRNKGMKVVSQMEDLKKFRSTNPDKDWTADKEAQFDAWDKECVEIEKEIRFKETKEKFAAEEARKGPSMGDIESDEKFDPSFNPSQRAVNMAVRKFETQERKAKYLNPEERKIISLMGKEEEVFERFFRAGLKEERLSPEDALVISNMNKRAQSLTTTAGGYTVPQGFIPKIILYLKYISPFFEEQQAPNKGGAIDIFDVYRTDMGNDLPVPTGDDTANVGELLGENSDASSSSADLVFGQKTFKAYKYSSKMIKASNELLQDTGVDIVEYIARQLGTRLGRILNTHFTTGDGSSKPSGIITGLSQGKLGGTSGTISFTEIVDLVHSVNVSYRKSPSARFMLHDSILALLKKATVGSTTYNNRPLWAPGWSEGAPATIDGHQYLINNDMDSTFASGKKVMIFGDMKTFGVRWVNDLRMLRLAERYAEFDQVAWVGFMRADSRLLNTSGIKYYAGT